MLRRLLVWSALLAPAVLPMRVSADPTMDQLWPNADGLKWSYAQRYQSFVDSPEIVDSEIRLVLDGVALAPTSILAQYLHHETVVGAPSPRLLETGIADPFLQHLYLARPDLRGKIRESVAGAPCPAGSVASPSAVLLRGELAFRKTATEVAAWRCNLADTRAWQWLADDLMVGHHLFELQLIPDLASNVYLHGEVTAMDQTVTVPAGTFTGCVRVDYIVDYGTAECVDDGGSPVGSSKAEIRGWILFAPDVGPVETFEEFFPYYEMTGTCVDPNLVGLAYTRTTLKLASLPTPSRGVTWGRVKTLYR